MSAGDAAPRLVMPADEYAIVTGAWRDWLDSPLKAALEQAIADAVAAERERAEAAEAKLALIASHLPAVLDALRSRITDERWESQKTRFRDAKAALEALGGKQERSDGKEPS